MPPDVALDFLSLSGEAHGSDFSGQGAFAINAAPNGAMAPAFAILKSG